MLSLEVNFVKVREGTTLGVTLDGLVVAVEIEGSVHLWPHGTTPHRVWKATLIDGAERPEVFVHADDRMHAYRIVAAHCDETHQRVWLVDQLTGESCNLARRLFAETRVSVGF